MRRCHQGKRANHDFSTTTDSKTRQDSLKMDPTCAGHLALRAEDGSTPTHMCQISGRGYDKGSSYSSKGCSQVAAQLKCSVPLLERPNHVQRLQHRHGERVRPSLRHVLQKRPTPANGTVALSGCPIRRTITATTDVNLARDLERELNIERGRTQSKSRAGDSKRARTAAHNNAAMQGTKVTNLTLNVNIKTRLSAQCTVEHEHQNGQ